MTEKTYEMMWDCAYCGTKKLLGKTHRFCAECGAPQDPSKRYFPPEDEKVAVEDHQFVGADVHCPSCSEPQSAAVKHCANCGGPMEGGKQAVGQADQVIGPNGQVQQPHPPPGAAAAPGAQPEKESSKAGCIIAAIALVVLGIVGLIVANRFWTSEASLEVTKLTWKRTIAIEEFDMVKDKGACKDMPDDAKVLKRSTPKKKCKTRRIDNKDGTFKEKEECDKPVEQCEYQVGKWKTVKTLKKEGGVDDKPKWPASSHKKKKSRSPKIGDVAEGERSESYIVHFKDKKGGDTHTCSFSDEKKWKKFEKGDQYKGETGMIGGDLKCDKLKKK